MLTFIAVVAAVIAIVIISNWRLELFRRDLHDDIKKIINETENSPKAVNDDNTPQRARDSYGRFVADNPETPQNEAWVGGVKPPHPVKRGPRKSKK